MPLLQNSCDGTWVEKVTLRLSERSNIRLVAAIRFISGGFEIKSYFEENGGTYTQVGGYLIPDLVMDPQPEGEIGIWGQRGRHRG